jgi:MFS family permease
MLRELHLAPWEYGLALGLPCLGGVIGSRLAPRLTRWLGLERVLLVSGVLRTPWTVLLAFVPTGTVGLVLIVVLDTGLLLAAGVFNPLFATFRMQATDDAVMSRVYSAWSVSSRTVQPVMIAAGGALAAVTSTRAAIAAAGVLCLASALLVPRSGQARAQAEAREQPGVEEGVDVPDPVTADLERLDAPRLVPAVGGGLVVSERRQRVDQGRHQHQV